MKPKIFYHKKDLDGHFSGLIAKYYFDNITNEEIELIPFDYGMELPNIGKEDLYFLDVTPDRYEILNELDKSNYLTVIDHHKTFINYLKEKNINLKGYQVDGLSGCELTWQYFFTGKKTPRFITLLGRYDVWDNLDTNKWEKEILPFQYGMRMELTNPIDDKAVEKFFSWIKEYLENRESPKEIDEIINNGKIIITYQSNEDRKAIEMFSFEARFNNMVAICMNNARFNSQVFSSKWDPEEHHIMINFVLTKGKYYTVSLYTDRKDIDCGKIAREYGGGGHQQAAGFIAEDVLIKEDEINFKIPS
jgi:uncharacterized protein